MSVTITGLVVAGLSWLLQHTGVQVGSEALSAFVFTFFQVAGAIVIYIGRVRQGDITWYGTKKVLPVQ